MKTLVVTNDFPPRPGGIQEYVHALAVRQPADEVVVYASSWKGAEGFDAVQPFLVVRDERSVLLPTARVSRRAHDLARAEGCDRVWYGASAPLGLMGRLGLERAVASTHGHEVGWARLPVARAQLKRIGRGIDVATYLGEYTRSRLAPCFPVLERLPPGVDVQRFHPDVPSVRDALGLASRPVIVCVSRVVPRKGQDVLVRALPLVQQVIPDAALLIVGGGPALPKVRSLAIELGVSSSVVTTGSVPWEQLPAHYAAGDVFAMPCRSRFGGLEVEGLGIVFLEASATGLPVVAGRSGGSPDAVLDGVTGHVVDGTSVEEVAASLVSLLQDPVRAQAMGAAGRAWVEQEWQWNGLAQRLRSLLAGRDA